MLVPAPKTIEDYVVGVLGYPSLGAYFSPSLNPGEGNPGTALAEMTVDLMQEYIKFVQGAFAPLTRERDTQDHHDNS